MNKEEIELRKKLADDLLLYARSCLNIRPKDGGIQKFSPNKAQLYINSKLDEQLKKTGKVKAIILKGRQQGCSTLIAARFFHKVVHSTGKKVFILTHRIDSTDALFDIVKRYYKGLPDILKPSTSKSNSKELVFDALDSSYKVSTARASGGLARGETIQFLHGSEVAFWNNFEEHQSGLLQAFTDGPGTEIIFESTANSAGDHFHQMWQRAINGESVYSPIFVPWYWQDEYKTLIDGEFIITPEEEYIRDLYKISNEQIMWRRNKIIEFGIRRFKREYPFVPEEAFQYPSEEPFIPVELVIEAMQTNIDKGNGPIVLGVDPAHLGKDRSSLIRRQGRVAYGLESYTKIDHMEFVGIINKILRNENISKVFVDASAHGVIDRLRELGYEDRVVPVYFGGKALDQNKYYNKRSEIWGELKEWLKDKPVSLPQSYTLSADLAAPQIQPEDSKSRIVLESKDSMSKRGIRSPDEGDALALTFSQPVSNITSLNIRQLITPSLRFR